MNYEEIEKYSHIATMDEIKGNDYNLNIPRYVDTFEEEAIIDIDVVNAEIAEIKGKIAEKSSVTCRLSAALWNAVRHCRSLPTS
mgnify:CR=1 FL=1